LLLPGSVATVTAEACTVTHPYAPETIFASTDSKTAYLRGMQARRMPQVDAERLTWAHPELDVYAELKAWFEPLLTEADSIAHGVGGGIRLTCEDETGDVDLIIDFVERDVRRYAGEKVRYEFRTRRAYIEQLISEHTIDWTNSLFLSCRFSAHRIGPYNEYVYTFFKCLSEERLQYADGWFAEQNENAAAEMVVLDGWQVQRRCPHLKADLSRFGTVEDDVLTCTMHGWTWDLTTGECLSSVGRDIVAIPTSEPVVD
jgi:UDP-MurNAc hydroxylase